LLGDEYRAGVLDSGTFDRSIDRRSNSLNSPVRIVADSHAERVLDNLTLRRCNRRHCPGPIRRQRRGTLYR
jgi:hypothetical protein